LQALLPVHLRPVRLRLGHLRLGHLPQSKPFRAQQAADLHGSLV
jgi:hypothetical protein